MLLEWSANEAQPNSDQIFVYSFIFCLELSALHLFLTIYKIYPFLKQLNEEWSAVEAQAMKQIV